MYNWSPEQQSFFDHVVAQHPNTQGGISSTFNPVYSLLKIEATAG